MCPQQVIDLRPRQPSIGLPPDALIDSALTRVQRCYADTADYPAAILLTAEQWAEVEKFLGRPSLVSDARQLWGIPVEVLGSFPRLIGGDLHGLDVPSVRRPRFATWTPGGTVEYDLAVVNIFGERLEFWTCLPLDEALPLLGRELLRAAARQG